MKRRVAIAVVLVAVAVAAVAAVAVTVADGGSGSQLSESYRKAARRPCAAFKRTVAPLRVGAGFEDFARQTAGFRSARSKLADDLRRLVTADDDRRKLKPLLGNLAAGNLVLADARRLDAEGQVRQAFRRLDDFTRLVAAEARITKRLGLSDCG